MFLNIYFIYSIVIVYYIYIIRGVGSLPLTREVDARYEQTEGEIQAVAVNKNTSLPQSTSLTAPSSEGAIKVCCRYTF
jgi:hypothetical protein